LTALQTLSSAYKTQVPPTEGDVECLFEAIALDLIEHGFSVRHNALPDELADVLYYHLTNMPDHQFTEAGIGRQHKFRQNAHVRNDEISWINGNSPAGLQWLNFTTALQIYLNRRLFLGLFSFESHFAHYAPGRFYKRHLDAFKGQANRMLSLVIYLNPEWEQHDGGELIIYRDQRDQEGITIAPKYGTLAVFLSEEFEHEVKPTKRDRYSIAGWFRLNSSTPNKVDPPK
jgi:SM-20-related protein